MTRRPRPFRTLIAAVALVAVVLAGCSDDDDDRSDGTRSTSADARSGPSVRQPALEGSLAVAAAEPFAAVLPALVEEFGDRNPAIDVTFRIGGSGALTDEVLAGEPTDVVLLADRWAMGILGTEDRLDGSTQIPARDKLVLVTPAGNPTGISALADLARVDAVVLCEAEVPCGAGVDEMLDRNGVDPASVRRVAGDGEAIASVLAGDAPVAVVLASAAAAAGDSVVRFDIPVRQNVVTAYQIAAVAGTGDSLAARAFVDFVMSLDGQDILADHGFLAPPLPTD